MNINYFINENLFDAGRKFFQEELLINLSRVSVNKIPLEKFLSEQLKGNDASLLNEIEEAYFLGLVDDDSLNNVFKNEAKLEDEANKDSSKYQALMVFAIKLKSQDLTRTDIARITRAFNRRVVDKPVVLLCQYGRLLSFSTAERTNFANVKKQGEKVGKISMLKDIDIESIHPGHRQILWEMKVNPLTVDTFEGLYKQWQKVFSVSLLNENFYNELFNWYLWATKMVKFPKPSHDEIDEESHASISVIRLLTRLIFIWFIKEKKLIPKEIFNKDFISKLLKGFDPSSSKDGKYYKAVLQNLFFASLNTEMNKDNPGSRRFLAETKSTNSYSDDYQNQLVYRYKELFKNENEALQLFENIPFLNGGLFECLDYTETIKGKNVENRYDGFSSQPKKQAFVPDVLFFGEDPDLDLSGDFENDRKKKHTKVRGIIEILNSYKFTITENTPLEEEIALDPELLGRVFENLLASYNPETKTTARKKTGSFYTPREIVGYMVDESLKTYLLQTLLLQPNSFAEIGKVQTNAFGNEAKNGQSTIQEELIENTENQSLYSKKLDELFDYSKDGNPFDEERTSVLISAISECKILDPACGSGAFPMGILHRMVYLLGKLDPNNKQWKEVQLKKAEKDLKLAKQMTDEEIREKAIESAELRIEYIKLSFSDNHHELDYTRKLFLIQHCIYGVDIQQIAIQISKLRFFISLIVEQRVDDRKPNRNVLSMPNLETKFVAANTLIELDKPKGQSAIIDPEVEKKEKELSEIRQKIFFTRKYKDKKKLKEAEKKKREELKIALVDSGFGEATATQMASWNPFDPIQSAPFFDVETMFGFRTGFNIVIGNPPYVEHKKLKEFSQIFKKQFTTYAGTADLYVYFYEKGLKELQKGGILSYITSNKFIKTDYGYNLRDYLAKHQLQQIIDFTDVHVFDALVASCILNVIKDTRPGNLLIISSANDTIQFESLDDFVSNNHFLLSQSTLKPELWLLENEEKSLLKTKIELGSKKAIEIEGLTVNRGVTTGYNPAFIIDNDLKKELIKQDKSSREIIKPMLQGRNIKKWIYNPTNEYLIFTKQGINIKNYPAIQKHLKRFYDELKPKEEGDVTGRKPGGYKWFEIQDNTAYYLDFKKEKIIWGLTADKWAFAYDPDGNFLPSNGYILTSSKVPIKYILAILNSKLMEYYFSFIGIMTAGGAYTLKHSTILDMPIKLTKATKPFEKLVDKILAMKAEEKATDKYELELDAMVFKLYNLSYNDVKTIVPDFWLNKKEYEAIEI